MVRIKPEFAEIAHPYLGDNGHGTYRVVNPLNDLGEVVLEWSDDRFAPCLALDPFHIH